LLPFNNSKEIDEKRNKLFDLRMENSRFISLSDFELIVKKQIEHQKYDFLLTPDDFE